VDIDIILFGRVEIDIPFICRCIGNCPSPKDGDYCSFTFLTVRDLMLAGF